MEGAVEAVLMAADRPITASRIARALQIDSAEEEPKETSATEQIRGHIESLNAAYEETGRSFRIETLAGGYRIMTLPEFAPAVGGLLGLRESQKLTRAALEALSIIAYRQPMTRSQLETIRGVGCGEVIRSLLEKRLISIVGRAEELGRPMIYGTSRRFLEVFGLGSLRDLPAVADVLPPQVENTSEADEPESGEGEARASVEVEPKASVDADAVAADETGEPHAS